MAKFIVAGNTEFKQDDSAGTLRNLTQYIDNINNPPGKEVAQIDVTSFNDTGDRFIAGIEQTGEYTLAGHFDDTGTTGPDSVLAPLVGTLGSWEFFPVGTASGRRKYNGESLCISYRPQAAVRERVSYEARFVVDGTVTVGTA